MKQKYQQIFGRNLTVSKKYCGDKNHVLHIDKTKDYPTLNEAIDAIKAAGGIVFFAHVYIYKWAEDKDEMMADIVNNYKIDGLEFDLVKDWVNF